MKFKQLKYDFLKYAKNFCFSQNYSVFCTGQRAFICDSELNLLNTIEKLSYIYYARISPDETKLLLISNSNIFYLVDLNDFSYKKYTIRGKYNDNLEGRGCWSFDSKLIYIALSDREPSDSALRCYSLIDNMLFEDIIFEKYYINSIEPVKELNKYLLIGLDRKKSELDQIDCWDMIWFDGTSFEKFSICNIDICNDGIYYAEYEAATNTVIMYNFSNTFRCDLNGKVIEYLSLPVSKKITTSFSDLFTDLNIKREDFDELTNLSTALGLENVSTNDGIYKICLSYDRKKYYVGTHSEIYIVDAETKSILANKQIDYGVQNIMEISPNKIVISTWSGVKIYSIIE